MSLSPANVTVPDIPTTGGTYHGLQTITLSGQANYGYNLTMSSTTQNTNLELISNTTTGDTTLNKSIPTIGTPSESIDNYAWAWSIHNESGALYQPIAPVSTPSQVIDSNEQLSENNSKSVAISYGVRIYNPSKYQAGTYTQSVIYTATAKLPPAPTITNLILNDTVLSGQQKTLALQGTNLSTTNTIWIDLNPNGQPDTNELATNITTYPNTNEAETIVSFTNPSIPTNYTSKAGKAYDIYLETDGGVTKLSNALWARTESTCKSGDTTSDCQVDIDSNMIPITYNESTKTWIKANINTKSNWYDYNNKKWANAVTVKLDKLTTYKNATPGTQIDNNDVLGYWVYIPRYAYEVQRPNAVDRVVLDEYKLPDNKTLKNDFIINFEKGNNQTPKKTPADTCNILNPTKEQMWANGTPGGTESNILAKDYRAECGIDRTYPGNDTTKANKTTWATHPAFTWKNTNGTINKELNGIWVGKFETTGTKSKPTIKPNQHANISEYIGEQYNAAKSIGKADPNNTGGGASDDDTTSNLTQNSHNMASSTTHMLKNSEWGAIAYLSASKYGAGVNNVHVNSAYPQGDDMDADGDPGTYGGITGCGPNGTASSPSTNTYKDGTPLNADTIESSTACSKSTDRSYTSPIGQLASTTNNIYGIYDMSGGVYEYVMGNRTTSATQTTSSTSYFKTPTSEPYVDLYKTTDIDTPFGTKPAWSQGSSEYYYNFDACTWLTCGGHALHETKTVQSVSSFTQSWGSDYSNFVFSSGPWFHRGGYAYGGSYAGVFASYGNSGDADRRNGFRAAALCGV